MLGTYPIGDQIMLNNFISAAGAGFLVLTSGAVASSVPNSATGLTPSYQVAQAAVNTAAIEASVFQQINQYRASKNLPALTRNSSIENQARIHSQNMASGKVAFGHDGFKRELKQQGLLTAELRKMSPTIRVLKTPRLRLFKVGLKVQDI